MEGVDGVDGAGVEGAGVLTVQVRLAGVASVSPPRAARTAKAWVPSARPA